MSARTLRLVGGLVPRYMTPANPPDVPPHAGTTDVDVVLNVSVLAARGAYNKLRRQLKDNGFAPYEPAPGKVSSWQWVYELNGSAVTWWDHPGPKPARRSQGLKTAVWPPPCKTSANLDRKGSLQG